MSFLSIGFLVCGLAAAIPVFVHMIHRQNLRELPFSTLRFIRISEQKTRNKRRVQDLMLLLLRMAVLLLIAIGLANPTIRNLSNFWGGAQTSAVIILDNSASMGTIDGTVPRFETAIAQAEKILDELGNGDNIAVIVPCGKAFPENGQLFSGQDKVRKVLRDAKISYEKADLAAAVLQARSLLIKAQTPSKLIFVISDQQTVSWQHLAAATPAVSNDTNTNGGENGSASGNENPTDRKTDIAVAEQKEMLHIPVILVNCRQSPKPNVGLIRLDTKNVLPIAQVPLPMTVYLKNESKLEQMRRIDVYVDGMKQYGSTDIVLDPEGLEGHSFTIVLDRGGLHKGEVRLAGSDGNPLDDKLYFAAEADQGIPVALIKPMRHEIPFLEETYYIEKALQTGAGGVSPVRLTAIDKGDLLTEPLQNYAAVIAVNLPAPEHDTAERLVRYIERGGHVIWTCGDNIFAEDYNRLNDEMDGKLLPLPVFSQQAPEVGSGKDAWNIELMDGGYPAFRNLVNPRELFTRVLVYRRIPVDISRGGATVLAGLDDGMPLLVQRRVGNGSVTFLGTGVHVSWTNLPVRPIFVPMINQLIFQLAGIEQTRLRTVAGQPLTFTFKADECPQSVEVIPPSGEVLRRDLKKGGSNEISPTFVFEDTCQVGVYTLRPLETARAVQIPFSVNIDGEEIDSAGLTEEGCKVLFAGTPYVFAQAGGEIDAVFEQLKRGTSLWDIFLWGVLLVLVCEVFISNRFSQRKEDHEKGVDVRRFLPPKTPSLG